MTYQKSVQGLRAFAVLIVVFNHLDIAGFSGGFIGVDVFFVISGYLISSLLIKEYYNSGTISILDFYSRRIKRIFPALLITISATSLAGFLLFSEERFSLLINSSMASLFSVSNVYFWSQIGYFDSDAIEKPLLHTWSLGVEEQFYLVWPLLILFLASLGTKGKILTGIAIVSLISFLLNIYILGWGVPESIHAKGGFWSWFESETSTVFYLMPFRIFEFGIGAALGILFFNNHPKTPPKISSFIFFLAAFTLILATVLLDKTSVFPSYNALIVSCATAIIIYTSFNSRAAQLLLANKLMVFIGGLSYSLYLVHWPIISYYSVIYGFPSIIESAFLLPIMLTTAWAMYRFIEQPFRKSNSLSTRGTGFLTSMPKTAILFLIISFSLALNGMKNVDWRIPESRKTFTNAEWREIEYGMYCQDSASNFPTNIFSCYNDRASSKTIIAWGDSHANHLVAGLSEIFPSYNVAISYVSSCIPQSGFNGLVRKLSSENRTQRCIDRNHSFIDWTESYEGDLLIFISSAKRNNPQQISEINEMLITRIENAGHNVFVLGDFIRPGNQIAQCRSVPNFLLSDNILDRICNPDASKIAWELEYSKEMEALSDKYIPVHKTQCPNDECRYSDDNGRATYRDHHHLSMSGSIYEMTNASSLINKYIEGI